MNLATSRTNKLEMEALEYLTAVTKFEDGVEKPYVVDLIRVFKAFTTVFSYTGSFLFREILERCFMLMKRFVMVPEKMLPENLRKELFEFQCNVSVNNSDKLRGLRVLRQRGLALLRGFLEIPTHEPQHDQNLSRKDRKTIVRA